MRNVSSGYYMFFSGVIESGSTIRLLSRLSGLFIRCLRLEGEIELLDDGRPTGRKSPRQGRTVHGKDAKDVDIPLNEWARHAEAETFWALVALMGEVGDIVAADSRGLHQWGVCFTRQLKWADKGLYSVLVSRPGCVQM